MRAAGKVRLRRRALALAILFGLYLLVLEGGLRLLLFSDVRWIAELAPGLRRPGLYADQARDGLYWKLERIWGGREPGAEFGPLSPRIGWTGPRIDPRTFTTADEALIGERRPVLLYGDSFAQGMTPPGQCFERLLDRSPEGATHALINFGVPGYGTDQTLTMLEATIPRYAGRHPLVIFTILLDECPDRMLLSFRGMPKPLYELEGGELVLHPLEEPDAAIWWTRHPPGVASYLWRLVRGPHGPLPFALQEALDPLGGKEQVVKLNRALLERMHRELAAEHIEHCVLGFHGRALLEDPLREPWREGFVREICTELGIPYYSSRPYLVAALDGDLVHIGQGLYISEGRFMGHWNARGNVAVLEAIRQAIHGRAPPEDVSGVTDALRRFGLHPEQEQEEELAVLGRPARVRFHGATAASCLREVRMPDGGSTRTLGLFPGKAQPTRIEWRVESGTRFAAQVCATSAGALDSQRPAVRLRLLVDGTSVATLELAPGAAPVELQQPLHSPCTFALAVEPVEGGGACWARLDRPELR